MLNKIKNFFLRTKIEIVLIGLENSGKTTLLNQLTLGEAYSTAPVKK